MNKNDLEKDLQLALEVCKDAFDAFEAYRIQAMNRLEKDLEYVYLRDLWTKSEDEVERLAKIVRGLEK